MNKKIIAGVLAMGALATLGLTGCKDKDKTPETPASETPPQVTKYTVTFDADNNPNTQNVVREYEAGATTIDDIPAVPADTMNGGFAGVWDSFTLNDSNITVVAKYGNGSATSPYLIANASQFNTLLNVYASVHTTKYLNAENNEVTTVTNDTAALAEVSVVKKEVTYQTVKVVYAKDNGAWKISEATKVGDLHFKLIDDIYLTELSQLFNSGVGAEFFAGTIDGDGHSIYGFGGQAFIDNNGAMIQNIAGATIKNLNINITEDIASLVGEVWGGDNVLENITINGSVDFKTSITAGDNNESAFANFVVKGNLTMKNCVNNANFIATTRNFGIFLGGYAAEGTSVSFNGCVNNGDIVSSGMVGLFFGNNFKTPGVDNITIVDCKNEGSIKGNVGSSLIAPQSSNTNYFADGLQVYLEDATQMEDFNPIEFISTDYTATINGENIDVTNQGEELENEKYQLILQAYAETENRTLLTTIVLDGVINQEKTEVNFENALFGMMDLNTYKTTYDLTDNDLTEITWSNSSDYAGVKYFLDEENGVYVFDFTSMESVGVQYTLNITPSDSGFMKTIAVIDSTNNVVDFVVNFS